MEDPGLGLRGSPFPDLRGPLERLLQRYPVLVPQSTQVTYTPSAPAMLNPLNSLTVSKGADLQSLEA